MRILFLSPRQCWPPTSGAKLREYHLARFLGRHAEISSVFFSSPDLPPPTAEDLPFCRDIVPVPRPRAYSPAKILRGLIGRWPLTVLNYTSSEMEAALLHLVQGRQFDLVQFENIQMAVYAPLLNRVMRAPRIVYDWHNIESEVMRRYAAAVGSFPKAAYAQLTARRIASVEAWALRTSFGHLVCSERERRDLLAIVPDARITTIHNGVDAEFFRETAQAGTERERILFVGQMSYHANIEAAIWFTRRLWPSIRGRFPRWRFTIVGADPAPSVLALESEPAVEVTGTVADIRPYYREALAAVVPLRTGGGTRLKILEAMAAGVPVVSTSQGAEGMELRPGQHFLAVDRDEDWLPALEALASQDSTRARLVEAGLQLARTHYDWEVIGARLYRVYCQWLGSAS
jgi:glycosyltransferase involved in cell wall biosynthesis